MLPSFPAFLISHDFSGDMDLICNHVGTEIMIDALEWEGAVGWQVSRYCAMFPIVSPDVLHPATEHVRDS